MFAWRRPVPGRRAAITHPSRARGGGQTPCDGRVPPATAAAPTVVRPPTATPRAAVIFNPEPFRHSLSGLAGLKPAGWSLEGDASGVTLRYQWFRGTTAITGATKATYTVTTRDKGTKLTVRVRGSKAGYVTVYRRASTTIA